MATSMVAMFEGLYGTFVGKHVGRVLHYEMYVCEDEQVKAIR